MGSIGTGEIVLIFLAVLLIFGAKRIPEIARGLGSGIREFKQATREVTRELSLEEDRSAQVQRQPVQHSVSRTPSLTTVAPHTDTPVPQPNQATGTN